MEPIYLDHAATTPVHPDVVEAMIPYMTDVYGNPSSIHQFGRKSRGALDEARRIIADSIAARPNEIIFTSGGTEADNMAVIGAAIANKDKGNHIITTAVEHHAVLHTCQYLEKNGFDVTYLPVDETGRVSLDHVNNSIREDTILATMIYGNNEVGTMQPIAEIGSLLKEKDIVFHTDAVQAYGLIEMNVNELQVDLLSVSGHKINGPKGTGFVYVRDGIKLSPHFHGGEQERKRRAGTENVPGIVGLKTAVELSWQTMEDRRYQYKSFRQIMINIFKEEELEFELNGQLEHDLPHVMNVYFPGIHVESMLVNLDLAGIAASSGSACTAGSHEPSHVLAAMFGDDDRGTSSIRFSFGYGNTEERIQKAALETAKIVKRLRG